MCPIGEVDKFKGCKISDKVMAKRIKILKGSNLPTYATKESAGADLYANIDEPIVLQSLCRHTFPTGVSIALPSGYVAVVKPRSGIARKHGIVAVTGVVDSDYRGEIGVTLINLSNEPYEVKPNDRIAQLVISEYTKATWVEVDSLDSTERGKNGFGHSGR